MTGTLKAQRVLLFKKQKKKLGDKISELLMYLLLIVCTSKGPLSQATKSPVIIHA